MMQRKRASLHTLIWLVMFIGGLVFISSGCEPREIVDESVGGLLGGGTEIGYRRLVLDNEVKVMLVSDPRAERSAAAMSVAVGSLDDPPGRPGLVHFLEHMLFLGTRKYPEADSYQKHLSTHGGFSNAYTSDDHTNYFFQISHDGFDGGLDRFAQFFIAPLFNSEYTGREVKAVDSEHSKNLENDYWRVRQVQRSSYDPGHPINRFSTGNLKTLAGVDAQELRHFYDAEYSGNRMALALVSNLGLDELEKLVRGRFDQIRNRRLTAKKYPRDYMKPVAALRLLSVEPIKDQRMLTLEFPLPPVQQHYASKPLHLLSSILGHEGEGSLLSLLKAENLATSLSSGAGESTAGYASLRIRVGLTPEGLERHQQIVSHILGVIEGLRSGGIDRYLFDEDQAMAEINFRHRGQQGSMERARGLSALMQQIPMGELPEAAHLIKEFRPDLRNELLEWLRPENMLVTLVAKSVKTDKTEPHYGTRYGYRELTGEPYERLLAARPDPRWHLPRPNPYIPRRVGLRQPEGPLKLADTTFSHLEAAGLEPSDRAKLERYRNVAFTGAEALERELERVLTPEEKRRIFPLLIKNILPLPVRLLDTKRARVWFQSDWRLRQPKAEIILKIYTGGAFDSPREVMLGRLYRAGLEEGLNEYGYPIKMAGLSYGIGGAKGGVRLSLGGYSANILQLMEDLAGRLTSIGIDQKRFRSIKERMARGFKNARFSQAYSQGRYYRTMLLVRPNYTREALSAALEKLTLEDIRAYAGRLYERIYVEGVLLGNLDPDTARLALRRALDKISTDVLPAGSRVEQEVRSLPAGADLLFSERLKISNSLATVHYQVGQSEPRLRGALLIIGRHLGERFYFTMRTRQQLGYIVQAGMGQTKKTLSMNFLIQSGNHPADLLLDRIEAYIPVFAQEFADLPEGDFEKYREAAIQAKLERPNSLAEEAEVLFWRAFQNDGKFDHVSEDIKAVRMLSREEVEKVLHKYLLGDGVRRLTLRLTGKEHTQGSRKGRPVTLPKEVRAAAGW